MGPSGKSICAYIYVRTASTCATCATCGQIGDQLHLQKSKDHNKQSSGNAPREDSNQTSCSLSTFARTAWAIRGSSIKVAHYQPREPSLPAYPLTVAVVPFNARSLRMVSGCGEGMTTYKWQRCDAQTETSSHWRLPQSRGRQSEQAVQP